MVWPCEETREQDAGDKALKRRFGDVMKEDMRVMGEGDAEDSKLMVIQF